MQIALIQVEQVVLACGHSLGSRRQRRFLAGPLGVYLARGGHRCRAQRQPKAPIVVMTGARDAALRAAQVEANAYLAKPFDYRCRVQVTPPSALPSMMPPPPTATQRATVRQVTATGGFGQPG